MEKLENSGAVLTSAVFRNRWLPIGVLKQDLLDA